MSVPVALITGASSGIGLALTEHLLAKGWKVAMLDVNPPPENRFYPGKNVLFIKCNVASWDEQAGAFAQAFAWHSRLDFAALNAGIDDRDDIFLTVDPAKPPQKPSMLTFEVDLFAMYYGIKLFAHYNSRNSSAAKGGKIVITASVIALYPSAAIPQYAAAKSGCIGLVRALASLSIKHNITINAICPAVVKTGLAPKGFEKYYTGTFTPMSTIMRAYDELMSTMDGGNGQVVEAFGEQLVYREGYEVSAGNDLGSEEGWMQLYRERNIRMGIADFEAQQTNGKS